MVERSGYASSKIELGEHQIKDKGQDGPDTKLVSVEQALPSNVSANDPWELAPGTDQKGTCRYVPNQTRQACASDSTPVCEEGVGAGYTLKLCSWQRAVTISFLMIACAFGLLVAQGIDRRKLLLAGESTPLFRRNTAVVHPWQEQDMSSGVVNAELPAGRALNMPTGFVNAELPAGRALDVVLSFYNNNQRLPDVHRWAGVPSVAERQPFWIVYKKSDESVADSSIWDKLPVNRIFRLPNVGREGHTFLRHMLMHYDNLAEHTIFCQDEPHHPETAAFRLATFFRKETGFMSLSDEIPCECDGCVVSLDHMRAMFRLFQHKDCEGTYMSAIQGCFVVSKQRILAVPRNNIRFLVDVMEAPEGESVHNSIRSQFFNSTISNPAFGHVLERAWTIIFSCTDLKVMDKRGCQEASCLGPQCLDE